MGKGVGLKLDDGFRFTTLRFFYFFEMIQYYFKNHTTQAHGTQRCTGLCPEKIQPLLIQREWLDGWMCREHHRLSSWGTALVRSQGSFQKSSAHGLLLHVHDNLKHTV